MPNYVSVSRNTVGEEAVAAEGNSSDNPVTFDTVLQMRNGYSTGNLTKRACFDGNWYRQWPVAGSVGCLSASTKAYQMTLKISSATVTWEGRRRTFHVWRACVCTRWKEWFRAHPRIITRIVLSMEISKDRSDPFHWRPGLWHCSKKPYAHTQINKCTHTHTLASIFLRNLIYVTDWLDPKVTPLHISE